MLFGLQDFATGVVAAVRADVMRPAGLAALGAWLQLHEAESEVGAAPPFAALGELYLRECHERAEFTRIRWCPQARHRSV
jgi:hypothetical protein